MKITTILSYVSKKIKLKTRKYFWSEKNNNYETLDNIEAYLKCFGVEKISNEWVINDQGKINLAFEKAWQNRNFEINKFWTRAAYFWGFIALIFGAYFSVFTKGEVSLEIQEFMLILICLGIIFSASWHFVIRGSKRWQENWERHIDSLENFVTGPLYKTIYFRNDFYSVSKINQILSVVVLVVWIGLFIQFMTYNKFFPWQHNFNGLINWNILIPIIITIIFLSTIITGFAKKRYNNPSDFFIRRKPNP